MAKAWLVGETGEDPPDVYLDEAAARAAVEASWRNYFDRQLPEAHGLRAMGWDAFWRDHLRESDRSPIAVDIKT